MGKRSDEHWYPAFWKPDLLLPLVTTILSYTWSKNELKYWSAGEAARYAVAHHDEMSDLIYRGREEDAIALAKGAPGRIAGEAAELGKLFHRVADAKIRKQAIALTDEEQDAVAPFMETLELFRKEMKPTYRWTEATVYNRFLNYAGKGDCGIEFGVSLPVIVRRRLIHTFPPGTLLIGDYKSGNKIYEDTVMQLAGYGTCTHMDIRDELHTVVPMPKVKGGVVIHIRPDGYRVHGVLITPQVRAGWLHAKRWFDVVYTHAPSALGIGVRAGSLRIEDVLGIDV